MGLGRLQSFDRKLVLQTGGVALCEERGYLPGREGSNHGCGTGGLTEGTKSQGFFFHSCFDLLNLSLKQP